MRALVLFGLLAIAGCGLAGAGLGADQSDATATPDATSMDDVAPSSQDGGGGHDAPSSDSGGGADALVHGDGGSTDTSAAGSGDSGNGADTGIPPDADAADTMPPPKDGASDDASDGFSAADGVATCASAIPGGWTLAVYDLGTSACPASFTAHDVSGPPTVGASACSCTCIVTQDGTCMQGTLAVTTNLGVGAACNMQAFAATFNGPGCTPLGFTLSVTGPHRDQATPLPPQGAACSDTVHADSTQVSAPPARYCDVPAASADSVCNGTAPPGFAACIVASGATACPAGTPFVHSYVIEDSAALLCSCSGCAMTTTCTSATLRGFRDLACGSEVGSVTVNGACNPVTLSGLLPATVAAVEYTSTASSTCTAGSPTPSTQLANPRTICCR